MGPCPKKTDHLNVDVTPHSHGPGDIVVLGGLNRLTMLFDGLRSESSE